VSLAAAVAAAAAAAAESVCALEVLLPNAAEVPTAETAEGLFKLARMEEIMSGWI
jgi:hypothetical protein